MKKVLPLVMLIVFLISISVQTGYAQEDWSAVRKQIEANNQKMLQDMKAGNFENCLTMYKDDVYSLPDYEPMLKGISDIKEKMKKDQASGMKVIDGKFNTVDVFGSGNIAVEIGEWDMTMEMPGMDKPWSDKGKYMTVWEKSDAGDW